MQTKAAITLVKKIIIIIMQLKIQSCGSLNHALKWLSAFNDLKPYKKCDHHRQQPLLIIEFFLLALCNFLGLPPAC